MDGVSSINTAEKKKRLTICEWLDKAYLRNEPIKIREFQEHIKTCTQCRTLFIAMARLLEMGEEGRGHDKVI